MINKKELQYLLCSKWFNHLGSHIWHRHRLLANEYKMMFGLSLNHALISSEIKKKKQEAFEQDREKYLANISIKSKKYQFKKGMVGNKEYFSKESIEKAVKELDKINSKGTMLCNFCNMKTKHLESHIYNRHGYLKVVKTVPR